MKKRKAPEALPLAGDEDRWGDNGRFTLDFYTRMRKLVKSYGGTMRRSEILGMLAMVSFDLQLEWSKADEQEEA